VTTKPKIAIDPVLLDASAEYVKKQMEVMVRIPAEADQHSWMSPITIPV
jgi:hypothetical protein